MNEGVWKSFGLASTSSVTGLRELRSQTFGLCSATGLRLRSVTGEENSLLLSQLWNHNGGCVVNLVLLVFIEIDNTLRKIN